MKRFYKLAAALLCALALLLLAVPALASPLDNVMVGGEDVTLDGQRDSSVFGSGYTLHATAQVNGVLFAAGYNLNLGGQSQHLLGAGYTVNVPGQVELDAFLAGNDVLLPGSVGRDAYIAAGTVSIYGQVERNLYATGETVILNGRINGDAYLDASNITLTDTAVISGALHYNSTATLNKAPGAKVGSMEVYQAESAPELPDTAVVQPGFDWQAKLLNYLGLVALAFVLLWLTGLWPAMDRKFAGAPFGRYAAAFGVGCAVLVGLPLLFFLLLITNLGARLAFVLLLLYVAVILAAPLAVGCFLGRLVWRGLFRAKCCYWAELPLGLLLYVGLTLIPYANGVLIFLALALGIGSFCLLLGKGKPAPAPKQPQDQQPPFYAEQPAAGPQPADAQPVAYPPQTETPAQPAYEQPAVYPPQAETPAQPAYAQPAVYPPATDAAAPEQPAIYPPLTEEQKPQA